MYSEKHHRAVGELVAELDNGQLLMTALQTHEVFAHVNLEAMPHAKELSVDVINKISVRNVVQLTKNSKTNSYSSQNISFNIGELSEVVAFQPFFFLQVNIVPVIAKADTLTQEECTKFKKQVIHVYINMFCLP